MLAPSDEAACPTGDDESTMPATGTGDDPFADDDESLRPMARDRCFTWPMNVSATQSPEPAGEHSAGGEQPLTADGATAAKKSRSKKKKPPNPDGTPTVPNKKPNPWGEESYADLITKALLAAPGGRMKLNEIYQWFAETIPYFRERASTEAAAGWKNSIRHNLSLHSRFMRVQNEGAGKSSWWVLNPDARNGKATRRRAQTAENAAKCLERKRGRVRKKVAELRAAGALDPNGAHFAVDEHDAAGDFRGRSDSTLSNYSPGVGGRVSPSHASGTDSPYWAVRSTTHSYHGSMDPLGSQTRLIADMKIGPASDATEVHIKQEWTERPTTTGFAGPQAATASCSPIAVPRASTSSQYTPPNVHVSTAVSNQQPFPSLAQIRFTPIKQELGVGVGGFGLRACGGGGGQAVLPVVGMGPQSTCNGAPAPAVSWYGPPVNSMVGVQPVPFSCAGGAARKDSGTLPADIRDVPMDAWPTAAALACDIDAVIRHEISLSGKFDIGALENI